MMAKKTALQKQIDALQKRADDASFAHFRQEDALVRQIAKLEKKQFVTETLPRMHKLIGKWFSASAHGGASYQKEYFQLVDITPNKRPHDNYRFDYDFIIFAVALPDAPDSTRVCIKHSSVYHIDNARRVTKAEFEKVRALALKRLGLELAS